MTMKHGLLPEDRPQDHGAVREASTVASLLDVLGDATRLAILRSAGLISSHSHGRANVSRIESPEAIEQVLAAAESLAATICADGAIRSKEPQ
ncbi:transcriptional regulator [Actinomyces oris]|uniref:transcriptional regulator n=1 Tax=Actinomyces oris TaxID=544580 RepID=UPI00094DDDA9|nr:transcriptional regulator [Actinomyces oris]OLO58145.1 transcriptional regulator [Actinomyces oris]